MASADVLFDQGCIETAAENECRRHDVTALTLRDDKTKAGWMGFRSAHSK